MYKLLSLELDIIISYGTTNMYIYYAYLYLYVELDNKYTVFALMSAPSKPL
jgi:hypothetical protein